MKSKTFSQMLAVIIVMLVIISISFYYKDKSISFIKNNDADLTSSSIIKNNGMVISTGTPKLTFINKSIYDYSGRPSTTKVLQLVIDKNDNSKIVKNRNANYQNINDSIIFDYTMSQCDPSDLAFSKENGGDVNSYASIWTASTTMLNSHIWSMHVVSDIYCGGAHPSYSSYGLNYILDSDMVSINTVSGNSDRVSIIIDLKYIFSNYLDHKDQITGIVFDRYFKTLNPKNDSECIDSIKGVTSFSSEYSDGTVTDFIRFTLDPDGINIFSFGLPHVVAACEPGGYHIPYAAFSNLINPNFKKLLK